MAPLFALDHLDSEKKSIARKLIQDLDEKKKVLADLNSKPKAWIGSFRQPLPPADASWRSTVSTRSRLARILSAFTQRVPEYALDKNSPEKQRRIAFAEWLIDPKHPLTAA